MGYEYLADGCNVKEISEEIFFAEELIVTVDARTVEFLKQKASQNKRKRVRLCVHKDTNALVHEMIIVHSRGIYVEPHKHMNKSESFHVIEGSADLFFFDEEGEVVKVISMGERSSGKIFYYRVSDPIYHTLIVTSDIVVFQETTKGPFNRADTVWAPWAPSENDEATVKVFMEQIMKKGELILQG